MASKRTREQLARKAATGSQTITPEIIAKRTRRHLDELERANYSEPTGAGQHDDAGDDGGYSKGRARQTISDKRRLNIPGKSSAATARRSTMNVRSAILYRKNFATLLEESGMTSTYVGACAPEPRYPARLLCSVCGYWGSYRCSKCGLGFCERRCEQTHMETRCC